MPDDMPLTAAKTIAQRSLASNGLSLSEIGMGTASLGNLYRAMDDDDARETLSVALGADLRYFDTAPHYGRGLSERRLGDALRGLAGVTLSSKVGRLMRPDASIVDDRERDGFRSPMPFRAEYDYTYDGVMRSYEASLQRLGLARIDILYIHDIGQMTHGADHEWTWSQLTTGGGFRALEALRGEGSISGFGLGVNEVAVCLDALVQAHLDVILLAGRYTLLEQAPLDDLLPACAKAGTSVVIGGPYNSGILATGVKGGRLPYYNYAPAPPEVIARVAGLEAVAERHGVKLAAAALQFPLAHPQVVSVIPGLGAPRHVAQTLELYRETIPADFWRELKAQALMRPDAPIPEPEL
jgi:D-threo-aldose 1-dehydrogenase